jgi:hypothetical protein
VKLVVALRSPAGAEADVLQHVSLSKQIMAQVSACNVFGKMRNIFPQDGQKIAATKLFLVSETLMADRCS